jgi:protein SCO1/2
MKAKLTIALVCALTLCAAVAALVLGSHRPASPAAPIETKTFQVHGEIRGLDVPHRIIRVAHDAIPNYMPAMTMPLAVKDAGLLKGLAVGQQVQFELSVTEDDSLISHLEKINGETAAGPASVRDQGPAELAGNEINNGEPVPDFTLVDQNGRPIRLSDFRGKAVVLTFIYTRCPLPNFCPLMSRKFAALQTRLNKTFPGGYELLSVSIDPKFDRPEVLRQYAARYGAVESTWQFATGEQDQINVIAGMFGLTKDAENGLISHNLRTALIGADGRLVHLWKSNVWTPYEVERMMQDPSLNPGLYSGTR